MVARRKNGLEVHSSRLQLPRSESSLEVSEELPEWVQNCMPLVSWPGVSLELPLSNFNLLQVCLNTTAVLTP